MLMSSIPRGVTVSPVVKAMLNTTGSGARLFAWDAVQKTTKSVTRDTNEGTTRVGVGAFLERIIK